MSFENKISSQMIFYSQYIAAYVKIISKLGRPFIRKQFIKWLLDLGLSEQEAREIAKLADNGKLELEEHCKKWFGTQPPPSKWDWVL